MVFKESQIFAVTENNYNIVSKTKKNETKRWLKEILPLVPLNVTLLT